MEKDERTSSIAPARVVAIGGSAYDDLVISRLPLIG
jgi:hypothetical protein